MNLPTKKILDGNEAAAYIAYRTNEVCAIYPITPSSPMGEHCDEWAAQEIKNIWGDIPRIIEMQSEAGAAGAVHGSLLGGGLTTTFTSSQGLLLMIPNMFKIAGELNPCVIHVAARTVATHALSIFGDHSDVMAVRSTGFAMLFGSNVQEAMDFSLISQSATLKSRIPFLHIFDGFRTSHELSQVEIISDDSIRQMIDEEEIYAHRKRALSPEAPTLKGTAQNPDVFFQSRETGNPFYMNIPSVVKQVMEKFASITGRRYSLFDYKGHSEAEKVIVIMGSGAGAVEETVEYLNNKGEKTGFVNVHLFRPFSVNDFVAALPPTAKNISVLDRTKEPGAIGEPLYQDVVTALSEAQSADSPHFSSLPKITGGRYGLSSKEFTPAMVKGIFDTLGTAQMKNHYTIGIEDDVTHTSLKYDKSFSLEEQHKFRGLFFGLGADGTVSANKNSIKIIGESTPYFVQGYFVYDSKKAGSTTISHLRFGEKPIRSTYLITSANFIACHQFNFLNQIDILHYASEGCTFLLNSPYDEKEVWDKLPAKVQQQIIDKKINFYIINATKVAMETGMGTRTNTILQTCFFAISGIIPRKEAIEKIKQAIAKTYSKKGESLIQKNYIAVAQAIDNLKKVNYTKITQILEKANTDYTDGAKSPQNNRCNLLEISVIPEFFKNTLQSIISGRGDELPVSAFPKDGEYPTSTTRWEKRNIAAMVPVWDETFCTQCNKCVIICPHAAIRAKVYDKKFLDTAPQGFKHVAPIGKDFDKEKECYTLQVAVEDCTGCSLCVEYCPVESKSNATEFAKGTGTSNPPKESAGGLLRESRTDLYKDRDNEVIQCRDKTQPGHIENSPGRKAINMAERLSVVEKEKHNWNFFFDLPEINRERINMTSVKATQFLQPLFEFSSACAGCGETPYLKILTQLFGDRMIVANATGCSSIYGANLPTAPWTINKEGRGPAWANSLFEDNAEFGLGIKLSLDQKEKAVKELLKKMSGEIGEVLVNEILNADQSTEAGIQQQRKRIDELNGKLSELKHPEIKRLMILSENLIQKSIWIVGGDGWAYDIGYGGLDHVVSTGENINILVLDTEVYSNTGGQTSKATPLGAVAKFSVSGKKSAKKNLAQLAINYRTTYVAQIALGANDSQTVRAIKEAEAFPGTSLIVAYSHCIAHGYDLAKGAQQQENAVKSGYWTLFRFNPLNPPGKKFMLDSKEPSLPLKEFMYQEGRFNILPKQNPQFAEQLLHQAEENIKEQWNFYKMLTAL